MDVTRVDEYSTKVGRFRLINTFLIKEDDGFTLMDTAIKGSGKQILAAAALYGVPIRRILLTHEHSDHIGSLDEIYQALGSDVLVATSERGTPLLRGDLSCARMSRSNRSKRRSFLAQLPGQHTCLPTGSCSVHCGAWPRRGTHRDT